MHAEIISVGTELLMGQIVNTNAQYISQSSLKPVSAHIINPLSAIIPKG